MHISKKNTWTKIDGSYKNEFGVIVDEDIFELIKFRRIGLSARGYAIINLNESRQVPLHRFILNFPVLQTDHINNNRLDNRKSNLRICTSYQNSCNIKIDRKNKDKKTSKYKGVRFFKRLNKWSSQIGVNWKSVHLGYFKTQEDAARAYDKAAKEFFGEFAKTNFK